MKKFKIKGTGLDTTKINQVVFPVYSADYVLTSIASMNESLVKGIIKVLPNAKIVTYVDYLDGIDRHLMFHAYQLGRRKIDLLLVSSKCDIKTYKDTLKELSTMGLVENIGVYVEGKTKVEDLEKIKEDLDFKVVGIEVNPRKFQKSVIDWCIGKEDISIFGINPVPDKIAIEEYSLPYLLSFSAFYSDIVFVSKSNNIQYLGTLFGREVSNEKIYESKEVWKENVAGKPIMHPYLNIDGMFYPAFSDSLFVEVEVFKTKKTKTKQEENADKVIANIIDLFNDRYIPKERDGKNHTADFLPTVIHRFQQIFKDYDEITYFPVGENVVMIVVRKKGRKRLFRKPIEEDVRNYILHVTDEDKIMFTISTSES